MAIKRASIKANLTADATQWQRGCDTATAATAKLKKDVEKTTINGPKANFTGISKGTVAVAAGAAGAAVAVKKVFDAEVGAEQLIRSLAAVDRGTESLKTQMEQLAELAKQPGVGSLKTAAQASIQLQAVGMEAEESRKLIKAFGNEAAVMGLPEEELQAVVVSLRQMAKAGVDMENLKEIFSRMPRLAEMVEGIDRKDPLQFIRTLTDRLAKLPVATASAKEKVDGLADAWNKFLSTASGNRISTAIGSLSDLGSSILSGDRYQIGQDFKGLATDQMEEQDPLKKYEKSEAERAAIRAKIRQQEMEKERTAAVKVRQQQLDLAQQMNAEDVDAYNLALARAGKDEETVLKLEAEAELVKRINALKEAGKNIDEDILAVLRKQVAERLKDALHIRAAAAARQKADEEQNLKIANLRQRGKNRQADKAEDKAAVDGLVRDGMRKEDAEDLVRQRRDLEEDKALGPGRRRIRSLRKPASGLPERDRPAIPMPAANDVPAKPQNNAPAPAPESTGMGQDFARMLKELAQIRQNTEPTASEKQQGQRREAA